MACEEWRGALDIYLDGELDAAKAAELKAHLRACSSCTEEILSRVLIKRSVQAAGARYAPSAEFRKRIFSAVAKEVPARKEKNWRFVLIPAFLLVLATFLLSGYVTREREADHRVYGELADLHVATLASSMPVDVVSSDRHTVKPWFQGKIPFTFNLPELAGSQFSLLGGRVFYLDQTPGAHLIYQLRKHEISVFILPDRDVPISRFSSSAGTAFSFQTHTWTESGLRYFVLGDVNADDIQALAKLLKDAK